MSINTLDEVFKQARRLHGVANLDGVGYKACVYLGVKIIKDNETGDIKIYDPQKSVDYYVEVSKNMYAMFQEKGFKKAVIDLTLAKYKEKLERIKESVSREMNGNQSAKRLRILKESRETILNKYYKLTQKLNNE